MEKKIILVIGMIFVVLLITSFVSAEFLACFQKGEIVEYCSGYKPDWTCDSNNGCQRCMSKHNETENCYVHGSWPKCNQLPPECSFFSGNASFDITPPVLTLISPLDGLVYNSRKVLLKFGLNEIADVYYLDLLNGRGRWTRVCSDCPAGNPSYSRERSFKEGLNNLQFRVKDTVGNPAYQEISFTIDSKDPKISKTEPRRGFADGDFYVKFKEDNPVTLTLYYGNDNYEVDIESECIPDRKYYECNVNVDLDNYNGQEIEYWFVLTDIAGNFDDSRHYEIEVDTTFPVVNNDPIYTQGDVGTRYNKYIYFNLNITEENFDEVSYSYIDSRGRLRDKRLCSRLRDGICEKKKTFKRGHHDITVSVMDEAGNSIGIPISFDVDY